MRVNVVRTLERRLERLLEDFIGRAFSGRLHPSEIAGRMAREADFARFDHPAGPATANGFTLTVNPADARDNSEALEELLADEMMSYAAEQGLRLEGPTTVSIDIDDQMPPGQIGCHVEIVPGPITPWARLVSENEAHPIAMNRTVIGRSPDADVIIEHDDISRSHAVIWREGGGVFVRDLGSSNGTFVEGERVGSNPMALEHGSTLSISEHTYRFLRADA